MLLVLARVGPFKSIDSPQEVEIEAKVTVLVGMNESGKTVFLQALQKSDDVLGLAKFKPVDDYPRKLLTAYENRHETKPDVATVLTYELSDAETESLGQVLNSTLPRPFRFSISHNYKNERSITLQVAEGPIIADLASDESVSTDYRSAIRTATMIRGIPHAVTSVSLTEADKKHLAKITERIGKAQANWESVVSWEAWQWLDKRAPKFHYFGEYEILPSKTNLADLASRASQVAANPAVLTSKDRGVLALLRLANIRLEALSHPGEVESLIARMESVSIRLTDEIMAFWKQNEDLEVRIDIRPDAADQPPFNNGPNLYLRIANKRHRGVTTPFEQRSKGFIWFFSFLVWFDDVKHQLSVANETRPLILLLDEPGLSLHALAQRDFLRYIDGLAQHHQVFYTTHSPFMVHSDRLPEVRTVEDRASSGTVISDNVSWSDERTVFPLQAALGWTIAQNLFISERNLLVEGPADLLYLQVVSSILESSGQTGLRDDITIVPTGGLDKVVTFIALLGANQLKLAVLHDYRGTPEQKLLDLVRQKTQLAGVKIKEVDLPPGDRIVDRIERYLVTYGIKLRPSGGFNHYLAASAFARNPPTTLDADTLARFEALFKAVNALF